MFPGVEGGAWHLRDAHQAIRDEGVDAAIEIHDWWKPFGSLINLTAHEANRATAATIAEKIADYARDHPQNPIHLVGYSGGGGLAVFVAEALPADVQIENLVLAQPALSPEYPLSTALQHIHGHLIHHYAPTDRLTLGAGTTIFGTMDRKYGASAGKDGFDLERAVPDPDQRTKVLQLAWGEESRRAGHAGGHVGILGYDWNRRFIAPHLRSRPPSATRPDSPPPLSR